MKTYFLIFLSYILASTSLYSKVIIGNIKDFKDKKNLVGVEVKVNNESIYYTNLDGIYSFETRKEIEEISISYPGYYDVEVMIDHLINEGKSDTLYIEDIYIFGLTEQFHNIENGVVKTTYNNGLKKEIIPYEDGRLHGIYKFYSINEKLVLTIKFRKGKFKSLVNNSDIKYRLNRRNQTLRISKCSLKAVLY
ncbi:hypothetical protein KMW28_25155 [Flammeovirga yaeyamensis]|uniref:Carboxypeptidase-like regulatory domain-containing protein n=1 Tax=Flammeovirga yaeyamensis TaxID=367791 RepID=A0AAX1N9D6_9BACT|nr:hypothetical protein [Flammeovirga yaeyamensis]MBB3699418.1 antitoxin component YwqK of YwqJK toxin-antitoxin module [Flammeovirga yaeyamensis]NMF35323.1 hypothetical protein [Flammeovirga yaeyamensis]QWG04183.1 hypothetical protein KMW28_25155 [Flammeovirga yaeyamensis]